MGRIRREFLASKYSAGIINATFFNDKETSKISNLFYTSPSGLPDNVFKVDDDMHAESNFACAVEELSPEEQQLFAQLRPLQYLKAINSKLKFFVILTVISLIVGFFAVLINVLSILSVY